MISAVFAVVSHNACPVPFVTLLCPSVSFGSSARVGQTQPVFVSGTQ